MSFITSNLRIFSKISMPRLIANRIAKRFFATFDQSSSKSPSKIEYRRITLDDHDALLEFLRRRVSIDGTPLVKILRLPENELEFYANYFLNDALYSTSPEKICSFLAVDQSTEKKNIVGCQLSSIRMVKESVADRSTDNTVDQSPSPSELDLSTLDFSPKLINLIDFDRIVRSGQEEFFDPHHHRPFPYLNIGICLIEPEYRRLGVFRRLMRENLKSAREDFKCFYALGMTTSHKSRRLCEQEGFRSMRWIKYEDFYVDGKRVFEFEKGAEDTRADLMLLDLIEMELDRE